MSNLYDLINQAVSQLEGAKKRAYERRLKRVGKMDEVVDEVAAQLCDELRFSASAVGVVAVLNGPDFNGSTSLAIDPELVKQIVDLIVKILLSLFFKV